MRRFAFYILTALLTFGLGSFIVFKFFWKSSEKIEATRTKNFSPKIEPVQSYSIRETKQILPETPEEKEVLEDRVCSDKKIPLVWKELEKDEDFRERTGFSGISANCIDILEALSVDLNGDGQKEILLRGKLSPLCSAVGNCGFWIFEKKGKNYRKILASSDYAEIAEIGSQIKKTKTKGYNNILLKGHITAGDTSYRFYKFDGRKYKESKCLVNAYIPGTSDNPKWEFMSCREFYKRWENER